MRFHRRFGLYVTLLLPPVAAASDAHWMSEAEKLRDAALQDNQAFAIVESLTSEVGPRLAGTEGDRAGVAWAINKLTELGFDRVVAQDVSVPHWERGVAEAQVTAPFPQRFSAVALGGSIGTADHGIEAPVIAADNIEALKKLDPAEVRGKIVFLHARTERTRDGAGYAKTVTNRIAGPHEAGNLGAAGLVIRSIGTSNARLAHTGATRYIPGGPRIPAIAISNPDADLLMYQLATGQPVSLRMRVTSRMLPSARSANVIGDFLGQDPDAGTVLLGAHLDSWDLGTGAIDDGAGVAIVIEAARQIARHGKPRRTVRVVLYANEERGLSGARAYAQGYQGELPDHVAAIESDLGAGKVWKLSSKVVPESFPRVEAFLPVLEPLGVELGTNTARGGADIGILAASGVPILSLSHDASHYFDYHHTASDTLDKIDPDSLSQGVAAYAALMFFVANVEEDFGRLPLPFKP